MTRQCNHIYPGGNRCLNEAGPNKLCGVCNKRQAEQEPSERRPIGKERPSRRVRAITRDRTKRSNRYRPPGRL